jgi:hypothetical protein
LSKPVHANYRGLGLADMARAIIEDRSHRADGALALHALAVMTGMLDAAAEGRKVNIAVQCERPRPLEAGEARSLLTEGSSTTRPSSPPPCSRTRSST